MNKISDMSEIDKIQAFIRGLSFYIGDRVGYMMPTSLADAKMEALRVETYFPVRRKPDRPQPVRSFTPNSEQKPSQAQTNTSQTVERKGSAAPKNESSSEAKICFKCGDKWTKEHRSVCKAVVRISRSKLCIRISFNYVFHKYNIT